MMAGFFKVARIFAASALFLSAGHAFGCSPEPGWNETEFKTSKYVFIALVTRAEVRDFVHPDLKGDSPPPVGLVHAEYELIESLKGNPSREGTVVTINVTMGACGGVPIVVGDKYLFYVNEIKSNEDIPDELKRQMAPSDLFMFTASSVSFRESQAEEMLASTRALVESPK